MRQKSEREKMREDKWKVRKTRGHASDTHRQKRGDKDDVDKSWQVEAMNKYPVRKDRTF